MSIGKKLCKLDWIPPVSELELTPPIDAADQCPPNLLSIIADKVSDASKVFTQEHKNMLFKLIARNHDIFVEKEIPKAGQAKVTPIKINTGDAKPKYIRPERMSEKDRNTWMALADKLIRTGTIVPSTSPWAANGVVVKKPGKEDRPCVGFHRTINPVTPYIHRDPPRQEDLIDWAGKSPFLSSFDLAAGYHQDSHRPRRPTKNCLPYTIWVV